MKAIVVMGWLLVCSLVFAQTDPLAPKPIGQIELTAMVATGFKTSRLINQIQNRGVDFTPDKPFLMALQVDGADGMLLIALRNAQVKPHDGSGPGASTNPSESMALATLHSAAQANSNNFHPREAEPLFGSAVQEDTSNPYVHLAWGEILARLGQTDQAISEYRTALNIQPEYAEAHLDLAGALEKTHSAEALEHYRQAVALAPFDAFSHARYASALTASGDEKSAEEQKKIAAELGYPGPPERIRVGGQVEGAKLIHRQKPEYPPAAKAAHIKGVVKLNILIAKDGTIKDIEPISGDPALTDAAVRAVWQWRYEPTALNGQHVEVVTEIEVNFTVK